MIHRAAEMTWQEVAGLSSHAIALLPVGSTEAHGPHLPLATDVLIADAVCSRVAERLAADLGTAVIFPPLTYGLTDFAKSFAGTVSVTAETVSALICDACLSLATQFAKVAVVNHHLEPAHFKAVRAGVERARGKGARVAFPDHRRPPWSDKLGAEFTTGGSHAGHYETSLMMAAAPLLVREPTRVGLAPNPADLPALIRGGATDFAQCGGPAAYFGEPAKATAEEGERLLAILTAAVLGSLSELEPG